MEPLRIAVIGDIHGKIFRLLGLCARWQEIEKKKLDLVLQAGDFGIWPDPEHLDSATRKHLKWGSSELQFADFLGPDEKIKKVLDRLGCPVLFVKGNHEDFDFLKLREEQAGETPIPMDFHKKIFYLPNGKTHVLTRGGSTLRIGGLGGIGTMTRPNKYKEYGYIQEKDVESLKSKGEVDVLLCHDSPWEVIFPNSGSELINEAIKKTRPVYTFFSHYRRSPENVEVKIGKTKVVKVNSLGIDRTGAVLENSMGILEWHSREKNSFGFVKGGWLKHAFERAEKQRL